MANTFKKPDNQLIKYSAEGDATQIPEVVVRRCSVKKGVLRPATFKKETLA